MAAIALVTKVYQDGVADTYCVFAIRKANTSDTVDVSAWFSDVKLATVLWTTTAKSDKLTGPFTVTALSMATTGLSNDAGYLSVWGSAA